jgi:phosphate/sulfate permease
MDQHGQLCMAQLLLEAKAILIFEAWFLRTILGGLFTYIFAIMKRTLLNKNDKKSSLN